MIAPQVVHEISAEAVLRINNVLGQAERGIGRLAIQHVEARKIARLNFFLQLPPVNALLDQIHLQLRQVEHLTLSISRRR